MQKYKVLGLFTGKAQTLPNGQISAIKKQPIVELEISLTSLPQDEVVDQKYHGGDMRVIHHYSEKNYEHLKQKFSDIKERFIPGSFGENLYTEELNESELCIGDIFSLGTAKIQVTVPRRPCATINQSYEDKRVLKEVIDSGHAGWFYRVLSPGSVKVGDELIHLERPHPDLKLDLLFEQGYGKGAKFSNKDFLRRCFETGLLDKGWKPKVENNI